MPLRRSFVRFALAASLLTSVALLAATAPSAGSEPEGRVGDEHEHHATPLVLQALPLLQPMTGNASNDPNHRFGESHVAVNPTNPNNLVAVYNQDDYIASCIGTDPSCALVNTYLDLGGGIIVAFPEPQGDFTTKKWSTCGVFASFDRGTTWRHIDVPGWPSNHPELINQGDCSVAVGPDGSFYLSFDDLNWSTPGTPALGGGLPNCGIGMDKSTDGGLTWRGAALTGTDCDGPKSVGDLSDGRIYESSSGPLGARATANPSDPVAPPPSDRFVVSTTNGETFTRPHGEGGLDTSTVPAAYRSTSGVASAANGTLSLAFRSTSGPACTFFVGTGAPCLVFEYTTDAGATWTRHAVPAAATILSSVMAAADPSTPGHYTVAGLNGANRFVAVQTTNYGMTWSAPGATVIDPAAATNVRYHAWMAFSPTGTLGLTWSARQGSSPPTSPYKVYAAFSFDGGATWFGGSTPGTPIEVSMGASPAAPTTTPFSPVSDDYSHIALRDDVAFVTWADQRTPSGDRAGFFSAVRFLDYDFSGFLPLINNDGSSVMEADGTIPVEFRLSVKGKNVFWATATLAIDGSPAVSTDHGQGNAFRFDPDSQQYVFNASTNGLSPGPHTFTVALDDGTTHSVTVSLRSEGGAEDRHSDGGAEDRQSH